MGVQRWKVHLRNGKAEWHSGQDLTGVRGQLLHLQLLTLLAELLNFLLDLELDECLFEIVSPKRRELGRITRISEPL